MGNDDHLRASSKGVCAGEVVMPATSPAAIGTWPVLRMLRPMHAGKNILILLPSIVLGAEVLSGNLLGAVLVATALQSALYILNDLLDASQDRQHPTKRNRPIASGEVHPWLATVVSCALLLGVAVYVGMARNMATQLYVAGYTCLFLFYNHRGRQTPGVELGLLAFFYAARVMFGLALAGVQIADALGAVTAVYFLFVPLALKKRIREADIAGLGRFGGKAGSEWVGSLYGEGSRYVMVAAGSVAALVGGFHISAIEELIFLVLVVSSYIALLCTDTFQSDDLVGETLRYPGVAITLLLAVACCILYGPGDPL